MTRTIEIRPLETPVSAEAEKMTFPIYRRLLALRRTARHPEQGDSRQIDPLALVALHEGRAVGMILAELPVKGAVLPGTAPTDEAVTDDNTAQVLSVFVAPAHRHQGVATALFGELEKQVQKRDYASLGAVYTTGKASIEYLERIFEQRGWAPPEPRTVSVRFTPEAAFASDLLDARRLRILGRGLEIFPWSELLPEEMQQLQRSQREEPWIAPLLTPWRFDHSGFDPSSVGARYRGQVVGWAITHRVSLDVVRFTCSFMRKDLSRRSRIIPLYAAVLERLRSTPCRQCTFITPYSYTGMVEFIRRRLAPISSFVGGTRESRISLDSASLT